MKEPSNLVRVTSFLADGQRVGVGMPLIVNFSRAIPKSYRDDVQRRALLRSGLRHEQRAAFEFELHFVLQRHKFSVIQGIGQQADLVIKRLHILEDRRRNT